jgi:hypothetical protein
MASIMNNAEVERELDNSFADLQRAKEIIDSLGGGSNVVPYLNSYAIIKACGTMEMAFKTIIADCCSRRTKKQIKSFLTKKIRESSMNPSYEKILRTLSDFDVEWKNQFKANINAHPEREKIFTSITSLVDARNLFAHGGNPGLSINDTIQYYSHFRQAIELLDTIVN